METMESIISNNQQAKDNSIVAKHSSDASSSTPPLLWLRVSFLFASRFDQGSIFKLKINPIGTNVRLWESSFETYNNPAGVEWKRFTKFFPIDSPVQGVHFHWAGKDQTFWAGHYGAKIANISMTIVTRNDLTGDQIVRTITRL